MPAYWSHFVSQVSTQRARRTRTPPSSSSSSEHDSPDDPPDNHSIDEQPPESSRSKSDAEGDLKRENESLKRQIAELSDQVDQLRQTLDARAEQVQVLVVGMRHLRLQQRRWSSLSSVEGSSLGPEVVGEEHSGRLYNLDDLGSSDDDDDTTNELSTTFDGWIESDEEEKDEEPDLSSMLAPSPLESKQSKTVNQHQRSPVRSHTQ
ncbi:hypothetical protein Gpo141_00012671 [Globisporangium polare]